MCQPPVVWEARQRKVKRQTSEQRSRAFASSYWQSAEATHGKRLRRCSLQDRVCCENTRTDARTPERRQALSQQLVPPYSAGTIDWHPHTLGREGYDWAMRSASARARRTHFCASARSPCGNLSERLLDNAATSCSFKLPKTYASIMHSMRAPAGFGHCTRVSTLVRACAQNKCRKR